MSTLTKKRLRHVLHYSKATGLFTWRHPASNRNKPGDIAGSVTNTGHVQVCVDGRRYLAHRLAWLYVKGVWPEHRVDHRDTKRGNNRWSNLRECTPSQNLYNSKISSRNTSGVKGVSWDKSENKWTVRLNVSGKVHNFGLFSSKEDAVKVVREQRALLHKQFTNHG